MSKTWICKNRPRHLGPANWPPGGAEVWADSCGQTKDRASPDPSCHPSSPCVFELYTLVPTIALDFSAHFTLLRGLLERDWIEDICKAYPVQNLRKWLPCCSLRLVTTHEPRLGDLSHMANTHPAGRVTVHLRWPWTGSGNILLR